MLLTLNVAPQASSSVSIEVLERHAVSAAPETLVFGVDLSGTSFDDTPPNGVTTVYDATLRYYYFWDFGEGYTYTAPQTFDNFPASWKSAQTAIGAKASHTFRASGNHTVRVSVWGYVGGVLTEATGTLVVTIGNPDTVFSGTDTIFMSTTSGDFGDAPSGATTVVNSDLFDVLDTYVRGQSESNPKRVMMARGRSYTMSSDMDLGLNSGQDFPTFHVVAGPGVGAKPIVTYSGANTVFDVQDNQSVLSNFSKDIVFQDIDWRGPYDSDDNSGNDPTLFSPRDTPVQLQAFTLDGCVIDGFWGINMAQGTGADIRVWSMNDSDMSNYAHSMVYGYSAYILTMTGCRQVSKLTATSTAQSNGGFVHRSGAFMTLVSKCHCFCRQGWSSAGNGYTATQPALRLNASARFNSEHHVTQCTLEAGFQVLEFNPGDSGTAPNAMNAVVDSCYLVGTFQTARMVSAANGGLTLRNCIAVYPATTTNNNGPGDFLRAGSWTTSGNSVNTATPMEVYNCTHINLRGSGSLGNFIWNEQGFSTVVDSNNVVHEPNLGTPNTPSAPLEDSGTVYWSPEYYGYRDAPAASPVSGTANPATTCYTWRPETGSPAIGAATGTFAEFDFLGTRRTNPSLGAIEPA